MKEKVQKCPPYPHNGNIRLYNMFPYRRYTQNEVGIEDMTTYIPEIARMGFNAIWVNPLHMTGNLSRPHPDGIHSASGSLYAMIDDRQFNPLIFPVPEEIADPEEQLLYCEQQLTNWTKVVKENSMIPMFDLVLNHIGVNEQGEEPIKSKLKQHEKKTGLRLILPDINERWTDIQELDYYMDDTPSEKRGMNCEPKYLNSRKIDAIFEILWEPFITCYVNEYGFMGVRVDAITHIPVPVQQRAYRLIQTLVKEKHNQKAVILGELMVGNPEFYKGTLSACDLTHCMNPNSFFWGIDHEGGYRNEIDHSSLIKSNTLLSSAIISLNNNLNTLSNISILDKEPVRSGKLTNNTIYLYKKDDSYYCALNFNETDFCFDKAILFSMDYLDDKSILEDLETYQQLLLENSQLNNLLAKLSSDFIPDKENQDLSSTELKKIESKYQESKKNLIQKKKIIKFKQINLEKDLMEKIRSSNKIKELLSTLHNQDGGIMGVVGNHDVGTLKAKTMLDLAYNISLNKPTNTPNTIQELEQTYVKFKQVTIKGIRSDAELLALLQSGFSLTSLELKQLLLDIDMRMREKILISSMMCTGGWYVLAGDEFGITHKPEVFQEYPKSNWVGPSLISQDDAEQPSHDNRAFIRSINDILDRFLPKASTEDDVNLYSVVLEEEILGKKSANMLFLVLRYSAITDQYYLVGHASEAISQSIILQQIQSVIPKKVKTCQVYMTSRNGTISNFKYNEDDLLSTDKSDIVYSKLDPATLFAHSFLLNHEDRDERELPSAPLQTYGIIN